MATRLYPVQNKKNNTNNSIKLKINCKERIATNPETKDWLELTSKFDHKSEDFKIYTGLLDKRTNIVAKIGINKLDKEYTVAKKLEALNLPTFIEFNCIFKCLDDYSKMNNTTKTVCKKEGDSITVIIMPHFKEGRIDNWAWERSNFNIMKNVMKHVCMSLCYAKVTKGFLHLDLHLGNILLKKTTRQSVSYGDLGTLELQGLLPIIMDFEKSHFVEDNSYYLYDDIEKFLNLMSHETSLKYISDKIINLVSNLKSERTPFTSQIVMKICNEIDNLQIRSVDSERPPLPNWLKPQKL